MSIFKICACAVCGTSWLSL